MNKETRTASTLGLGFLICLGQAYGQFLPVNQAGKCELSDVVAVNGFSKMSLYANELIWVGTLPHCTSITKDSIGGDVSAECEIVVYSQAGILRKPAGSISYRILIETKEGKYRYTLSDFLFHYYSQDRNYQMVKTGKTKFLEEVRAPGWQKLWTDHRKAICIEAMMRVNDLKRTMAEVPAQKRPEHESKKEEW